MASSRFVSRGGEKLAAAIENWKLQIANLICLDVGSSTGGFVDCLLQNGAKKVYALDTAYGELAWKLRNDERVVVLERTNVLWIPDQVRDDIGQVDLVTIDAGWTKLELILPIVKEFLKQDGQIVALLKPHYEAEKSQLRKGVLPVEIAEKVKEEVINKIKDLPPQEGRIGFKIEEEMVSPILGGAGNTEYLLLLSHPR